MSNIVAYLARSAVVALVAALCGCATLNMDPAQREQKLQAFAQDTNDPLEPMNRAFLKGNLLFYQGVERPIAGVYMAVVPGVVRDRITSGVRNLEEPRIFINDVLQGRGQAAATTLGRFAINSTFGLAGMFDLAANSGLNRQTGDFGQTLFVWGIEPGPFVVLPVLGPATFRDGIGRAVDPSMNPATYAIYHWGGLWPSVGRRRLFRAQRRGGAGRRAGGLDRRLSAASQPLFAKARVGTRRGRRRHRHAADGNGRRAARAG